MAKRPKLFVDKESVLRKLNDWCFSEMPDGTVDNTVPKWTDYQLQNAIKRTIVDFAVLLSKEIVYGEDGEQLELDIPTGEVTYTSIEVGDGS